MPIIIKSDDEIAIMRHAGASSPTRCSDWLTSCGPASS